MKVTLKTFYYFHLVAYYLMIFQDTYFSRSFFTDSPFYFYIVTCLYFIGLFSLFMVKKFPSYDETNLESSSNLFYCTECSKYIPQRSRHCSKCHHCISRYFYHSDFIGTCIGKKNAISLYGYLFFELISLSIFLVDIIKSILNKENFIEVVSKVGFTILLLIPFVMIVIQCLVLFIQFSIVVLFNSVVIDAKHAIFGILILVLMPNKENPFNIGITGNISEFIMMEPQDIMWNVPDSPKYEQYCQKMEFYWNMQNPTV